MAIIRLWQILILIVLLGSLSASPAMAQSYQMTDPYSAALQQQPSALPPGLLATIPSDENVWRWRMLPNDLVYEPYLASPKESRLGTTVFYEENDKSLWDITLGGHVGLLRFGPEHLREGFQLGFEGSAQLRLDLDKNEDLRSTDYKAGIPLTWGNERQQFKFGYYHLSSHLGDEFLLENPGFPRLNFVRDVLVAGYSRHLAPDVRVYGEAGWGFNTEFSEPWEFQLGLDMAPSEPTGDTGAPFFAVNGHLREEHKFGGTFTAQTGWAWRSDDKHRLLRLGVQYLNGKSPQYSFFDESEQQIGLGLWYDF